VVDFASYYICFVSPSHHCSDNHTLQQVLLYRLLLCFCASATRLGSLQKIISRLIEQEKVIKIVLSSDRTASNLMPTWQHVNGWDAINDALLPLAEFTDIMSEEK